LVLKERRHFMAYTLAYAHDANGNRTAGDINFLIDSLLNGSQVRILLEVPEGMGWGPYEYICEGHTLHIKSGVVYATNTLDLGTTFEEGELRFLDDSYHYLIIVSTKGELEQVRWNIGEHTSRGHTQEQLAMKWFVR
jgi:hypothetical protein